jgi:hypothetical protein
MGDGRPVAPKQGGDLGQTHFEGDMCEVHGDLARKGVALAPPCHGQ